VAAARRLSRLRGRRQPAAWLAGAALGCLLAGAPGAAPAAAELATVAALDVPRYMGRWYQIAHLPNRFQAVCARATEAHYALREDGRIAVSNRCRNVAGGEERAEGVARRNRRFDDPARLEVRFAPAWLALLPFVWGDYWVMALEPDYSAALVGTPSRDYLWILAREPHLSRAVYARYLEQARAAGFDVAALRLEHAEAITE